MQSSKQGYVKGAPFVNRRYTKGYLFREKRYINGLGVGPRCGASPYKNLLSTPRDLIWASRSGSHNPNNGCEGENVWKGIHGIRDFDEIHSGIRVNSKFLDGIQICTPVGKRDSPKSWHGCVIEKENGMRDRGGKSSGCGILVKKKRECLLSRPC